jgi:hypothetical protein
MEKEFNSFLYQLHSTTNHTAAAGVKLKPSLETVSKYTQSS